MTEFTIEAKPGTDTWRKPPSCDVYSAPMYAPEGIKTTNSLSKFKSASLTFKLPCQERYDQAGLILALRQAGTTPEIPPKWIKTGIEYYRDTPRIGTVGTDAWSDWSIAPVTTSSGSYKNNETWVTVLVEKHVDEHGHSLWVYQVDGDHKVPLREINWPFGDEEDWEVHVQAYAAKPGTGEPFTATFKDLEVAWKD
ncbi:hypothetical protein FALBO_8019 [Fusarium albosuccineum]|uniref:Uncharacterized protein n=1 Tax=Fusarium albosuccineum TaxID=1237068 RepID=A0A8H4LBX3_9HYPO|nr:hypothetical protein FALBO_8019 [Fusarium albosuccineum]